LIDWLSDDVLCAEPLGDIQSVVVELSTKLDYDSW